MENYHTKVGQRFSPSFPPAAAYGYYAMFTMITTIAVIKASITVIVQKHLWCGLLKRQRSECRLQKAMNWATAFVHNCDATHPLAQPSLVPFGALFSRNRLLHGAMQQRSMFKIEPQNNIQRKTHLILRIPPAISDLRLSFLASRGVGLFSSSLGSKRAIIISF